MNRREYERINSKTEGAFYVRKDGELIYDFVGVIDNISEEGICVFVNANEYKQVDSLLEMGQEISFQAFDEEGYGIEAESGAFHGHVQIVRKTMEGNQLTIGCKTVGNNNTFQEYVENKKTYLFIKSINAE